MTYSFTCHLDESKNHQCGILAFENVTIMMDPAWNGNTAGFERALEFWAQLVSQTDIILLCHPTQESLGAYAALYMNFLPHFQTRIAVYATLPVANLGRVSTLDLYTSQGITGPVATNQLDLSDIDEAFDHVLTVKHSQILDLKSKFEGLTLVAHNSGYAPGGSIFCITTYSDKVIYAPRWNHTKDTILNSAAVLDITGKPSTSLMRPSTIITSTTRLGSPLPYRRRASKFKDLLREVISRNGTALIPTQIGGKLLDLLALVNDMVYEQRKYRNQSDIPIFLVSYSRGRTLTYARSMLEWLSSSVVKIWESRNNRSPFDLGPRFAIVTPEELKKTSGPKICFVSEVEKLIEDTIVASGQSEKTTIFLTEPFSDTTGSSSLLASMYSQWTKLTPTQDSRSLNIRPIAFKETVSVPACKLETLKAQDLEAFESKIRERRDEHNELLIRLRKESGVDGGLDASGVPDLHGDDDDDDDEDIPDFITATSRKANASVKPAETPIDIFINSEASAKHKMFPFHPTKVKRDDYGDVVDFSQFVPKDQLNESEKRSSTEVYDEDEDPYELEPSSKSTKKRRGDNSVKGNSNRKAENFDDVSYLETLNKPSRRIVTASNVALKCSVVAIDLSSLVDQRSMSVIWPSLKPRNVLLLAPKAAQSTVTVDALIGKVSEVTCLEFNSPASFETVIKSLDVSVDPELDQLLKWQSISDGYTIAHVVGRLVRDNAAHGDSKQPHHDKWVLRPLLNGPRLYPKVSLAIGDVKLAELKRRLLQKNHIAEFKGEGSLVIDGKVVVRKISDGETVVDGAPSQIFYEVKAAVAEMLAKV
ncbi:LADA_0F02322g1_1 [Lachancea dasiensis]|uniref:Cleavage and polyadenylation specificity factor subunit 2 n=1 Tax=Lachancea dasiensis TaxID=1072105 RepID=A0A1G4JIQ9_9SACH|nr:LADA_0F02322g1_1 [Lachancea dasiensis]